LNTDKKTTEEMQGFVNVSIQVAGLPDIGRERLKVISDMCRTRKKCPWPSCGAPVPAFSEVNKLFVARTYTPEQLESLGAEERAACNARMLPEDIRRIISAIPYAALIHMGFQPEFSHPRDAVPQLMMVLPPAQRPTIRQSDGGKSRGEDDLTTLYQDIVRTKNDCAELMLLLRQKEASYDTEAPDDAELNSDSWWKERTATTAPARDKFLIAFERMQLAVSALVRTSLKKLVKIKGTIDHTLARGNRRKARDLYARLHGKTGRLRGTLAAKRTDFSARSVISPDASHDIWQLGVPASRMKVLTFPERVTAINLAQMATRVSRGAYGESGATNVIQSGELGDGTDDRAVFLGLMDTPTRNAFAKTLKIGWVVERHLRRGDWVIFNRQPTLHRASIQAFRIYPVDGLSFRLPVPCTKPFNADFDGDEMNMHVLQGYQAVAEAQELMAVPHQMVTPQSNSVLVALVQETLVGAYIMSRRDAFVSRENTMQLLAQIKYAPRAPEYIEPPPDDASSEHAMGLVDWFSASLPASERCASVEGLLPAPAILKGTTYDAAGRATIHGPLWTGKQIFSWLLPSTLNITKGVRDGNVKNGDDWVSPLESVVHIRGGQLLTGRLCKSTVGASSLGIVHTIWRDVGPWAAAKFVSDAQRLMVAWLMRDGCCISIRDCIMSEEVQTKVDGVVGRAMAKADSIMSTAFPRDYKEMRVQGVLQEVIRTAGAMVLKELDPSCALACVTSSGAKGNLLNISQITAVVGQQTISGKRLQQRMGNLGLRSLACFPPNDERPEALGFVATSYIMGLTAAEYFVAMMAGREGIVSTAVETATSGYNQRRMTKNQESQVIAYDASVRMSSQCVLQLHYGADDYDGVHIERVPIPGLRWDDASQRVALQYRHPQRQRGGGKEWHVAEFKWVCLARDALRKMLRPAWGMEVAQVAVLPTNPRRLLESMRASSTSFKTSPKTVITSKEHAQWLLGLLQDIRRLHWCAASHKPLADDLPFIDIEQTKLNDEAVTLALVNELGWKGTIFVDRPELRAQAAFALLLTGSYICEEMQLTLDESLTFKDALLMRYARGFVSPGEGVGSVGASSIGEPSTQGALNVFHYSGIAGTNITTSGLPRFKQLINAVNTRDSANMLLVPLQPFETEKDAQHLAMRICGVRFSDVVERSSILCPQAFAILNERETYILRSLGGFSTFHAPVVFDIPPLVLKARKKIIARGHFQDKYQDDENMHSSDEDDDDKEGGDDNNDTPKHTAQVKNKAKRGLKQSSSITNTLCTYAADFLLNKSAMVRRNLTPWDIAQSIQEKLGEWVLVLASEEFEKDWIVRVRALRTQQLSGAELLHTLSVGALDRVHMAVAEALLDALLGEVTVHGLDSITASLGLKVTQDVVGVSGGLTKTSTWGISTLGSDMYAAAMIPGISTTSIMSNNVQEVCDVLGVEAAVALVASELQRTLCFDSSYVDPRHPQLLADTQGRSGAIMALNCHNMEDMGSSLLQRASFERTLPVLQCAALFSQSDSLGGATEKQIVGLPIHVGTGIVDVISSQILKRVDESEYVAPLMACDFKYNFDNKERGVAPLDLFEQQHTRDVNMGTDWEEKIVMPLELGEIKTPDETYYVVEPL
jgi:DNA-directed RNA polymerase beta' subunit